MKQAVLISIKPRWCELIASGKKTVEVRKTRPNMLAPFKCYIYQTQGKVGTGLYKHGGVEIMGRDVKSGKVIGEFICNMILPISIGCNKPEKLTPCEIHGYGLTDIEIMDYLGNGVTGYAWYITDLKIYDTPKELSEFKRWNRTEENVPCAHVKWLYPPCEVCKDCNLQRPPQSWCYVEELKE